MGPQASPGRGLIRAAWTAVFLGCLLGTSPRAAAAAEDTPRDPVRLSIERERARKERRTVGVWRVRATVPQRVAAGFGMVLAEVPADFPCTASCEYRGAFFQVDPGLSGIQLGAGWAVMIAAGAPDRPFRDAVHIGFGIKGCLLRTWGDPAIFASRETFAGAEAEVTLSRINVSLALFRSLAADAQRRWRVAAGIGYGF